MNGFPMFKTSTGFGFVLPAGSGLVDIVYFTGEPKQRLAVSADGDSEGAQILARLRSQGFDLLGFSRLHEREVFLNDEQQVA